jgi:5S rRNA maturation endonuclease (ribonuclease M5)
MTTQEVLALLDKVQRAGAGWIARCPAHEDDRASLSVGVGDNGGVLLRCHAGCKFADIVKALHVEQADLFPPKEERKLVATYDYRDEDGQLLYQVLRYSPKDFRQRAPDGAGGWTWKLNGVKRVPYHLPELAKDSVDGPIFVVEGEKDADRLAKLVLLATTNAGGAGKWSSISELARSVLAGRTVYILPDNDDPGREHARQVLDSLQGAAAEVRIVELPNLPLKGDVSDFIAAGGTTESLLAIVQGTPVNASGPVVYGVDLRSFLGNEEDSDIDVQWLVEGILPFGSIPAVIAGPPKAKKSLIAYHMGLSIAVGQSWLGHFPTRQGRVLFLGKRTPRRRRGAACGGSPEVSVSIRVT